MQKFITALTDMSFKKFVTPQLATYIYVIGIILAGVYSLLLLKLPFGFLLAPINFIAGVILIRCLLELTLAVFQIARYSAEIARRGRPPQDETDDSVTSEVTP